MRHETPEEYVKYRNRILGFMGRHQLRFVPTHGSAGDYKGPNGFCVPVSGVRAREDYELLLGALRKRHWVW